MHINYFWRLHKNHNAEFCDFTVAIRQISQTFDEIKTTPAAICNQIGKYVTIYGFSFNILRRLRIVESLKKEIARCQNNGNLLGRTDVSFSHFSPTRPIYCDELKRKI